MDGHFTMDERRWREKVRRFEFEAKDLKTKNAQILEELNFFLGRPSADEAIEQVNHLTEQVKLLTAERDDLVTKLDAADAEVKALNHKVGGLKMTLGRYTKKDKN